MKLRSLTLRPDAMMMRPSKETPTIMTQRQAKALFLGINRAIEDAKQGHPRSEELTRLVSRALILGAKSYEHLQAIAAGEMTQA